MKTINQYINEKLIVNNTIQGYNYHPKTKDKLIDCIKEKIKKKGYGTKDKPLDLNDIDTSEITDMNSLFDTKFGNLTKLSKKGYFDISYWKVNNVVDMTRMFAGSNFNGDISEWNVGNVDSMNSMFSHSKFNGDISEWNVGNVTDMRGMFEYSDFDSDISKWDVSNVTSMKGMFYNSIFNKDISKWNVSNVQEMDLMFTNSHFCGNISKWNVDKVHSNDYIFMSCPISGKNMPIFNMI